MEDHKNQPYIIIRLIALIFIISCIPGCIIRDGSGNSEGGDMMHDKGNIVFDLTCKRYINGITELEREKYFNLHSAGESDEVWNYLKGLDLNINLGRSIGMIRGIQKQVTENPLKQGYADPFWLYMYAQTLNQSQADKMLAEVPNRDIVVTGDTVYPQFLIRNTRGSYPDGDAASDLWTMILKITYNGKVLPKYIEVMNEPDALAFNNKLSWDDIVENHIAVAKRLDKEFPGIMVGGPCLAYPEFSKRDFIIWNKGMKYFIENAGAEMDFLATHCYDFYISDGAGRIYSGGRDEANLDLIENHMYNVLGEVKDIVISEYGGYAKGAGNAPNMNAADGAGITVPTDPPSLQNWYMLDAVCSKLMSFMERPDRIVKSIPFILGYTSWNPSYYAAMIRKEDGIYTENHLTKFYRFWRNVRGERILASNIDPDIQVIGFLDGKKAYLCLNNLSGKRKDLSLEWRTGGVRAVKVNVSRLYYESEPILVTEGNMIGKSLHMSGHEKVIVELELNREPKTKSSVNEVWYYGNRTVVPVSGGVSEEFTVVTNTEKTAKYAELRLGLSRPHSKELFPEVTINGTIIEIPAGIAGNDQKEFDEYFGIKAVTIPLHLLDNESGINKVTVRYPDYGGYISTVIIKTGHES